MTRRKPLQPRRSERSHSESSSDCDSQRFSVTSSNTGLKLRIAALPRPAPPPAPPAQPCLSDSTDSSRTCSKCSSSSSEDEAVCSTNNAQGSAERAGEPGGGGCGAGAESDSSCSSSTSSSSDDDDSNDECATGEGSGGAAAAAAEAGGSTTPPPPPPGEDSSSSMEQLVSAAIERAAASSSDSEAPPAQHYASSLLQQFVHQTQLLSAARPLPAPPPRRRGRPRKLPPDRDEPPDVSPDSGILSNHNSPARSASPPRPVKREPPDPAPLDPAALDRLLYTDRVLYPPRARRAPAPRSVGDSLDPAWRQIDLHRKYEHVVSGYRSEHDARASRGGARRMECGYRSDYGCRSASGYRSDRSSGGEKRRVARRTRAARDSAYFRRRASAAATAAPPPLEPDVAQLACAALAGLTLAADAEPPASPPRAPSPCRPRPRRDPPGRADPFAPAPVFASAETLTPPAPPAPPPLPARWPAFTHRFGCRPIPATTDRVTVAQPEIIERLSLKLTPKRVESPDATSRDHRPPRSLDVFVNAKNSYIPNKTLSPNVFLRSRRRTRSRRRGRGVIAPPKMKLSDGERAWIESARAARAGRSARSRSRHRSRSRSRSVHRHRSRSASRASCRSGASQPEFDVDALLPAFLAGCRIDPPSPEPRAPDPPPKTPKRVNKKRKNAETVESVGGKRRHKKQPAHPTASGQPANEHKLPLKKRHYRVEQAPAPASAPPEPRPADAAPPAAEGAPEPTRGEAEPPAADPAPSERPSTALHSLVETLTKKLAEERASESPRSEIVTRKKNRLEAMTADARSETSESRSARASPAPERAVEPDARAATGRGRRTELVVERTQPEPPAGIFEPSVDLELHIPKSSISLTRVADEPCPQRASERDSVAAAICDKLRDAQHPRAAKRVADPPPARVADRKKKKPPPVAPRPPVKAKRRKAINRTGFPSVKKKKKKIVAKACEAGGEEEVGRRVPEAGEAAASFERRDSSADEDTIPLSRLHTTPPAPRRARPRPHPTLRAGLFSDYYKRDRPGCGTGVEESAPGGRLLGPPHCERWVRRRRLNFTLPYDIWWTHRRGQDVPSWNYRKIRTNVYQESRPAAEECEAVACNCAPTSGCPEDCINRLVYAECSPQLCPCGAQCRNQRIQRHEWAPALQRFMTRGKGWGVRTGQRVACGEFILEYVGEVVSDKEFKERMAARYARDTHHYCLHLDGGLVIDGHRMGGLGRFVNHSCRPNCEMQKWTANGAFRMALFALRDIAPGEELTYDYNFSLFNPADGQPCMCGAAECRGVIGGKSQRAAKPAEPACGRPRKPPKCVRKRAAPPAPLAAPPAAYTPLSAREAGLVRERRCFLLRALRRRRPAHRAPPPPQQPLPNPHVSLTRIQVQKQANAVATKTKKHEDVIRCMCGLAREEGVMVQCGGACGGTWQHARCMRVRDLAAPHRCLACRPRHLDPEVPLDETSDDGHPFYLTLMRGDLQVRQGDTVYVLRDIDIDEKRPDRSRQPASRQRQRIKAGEPRKHTYKTIGDISVSELDIFRVERLWKHKETGERYVYGHHYLRPHETFHEPTRKFFPNEVMRVPLYEAVPIDLVMSQCWVMDLNTYCKGRPIGAIEEHVYICELRVDRGARLFSKAARNKYPICTASYAFTHFPQRLKMTRTYAPHEVSPKYLKGRGGGAKKPTNGEVGGARAGGAGAGRGARALPPGTPRREMQKERLNAIVARLSARRSP